MSFAAMPKRVLTPEEVQRYQSDGVLMVRQALEPNWLQLIEAGVEQARRELSMIGRFMSRKTAGYQMDIFLWKRIDYLRDLIYYGPFAHWAKQLTGAEEIRFFYDQMFVKEPGTDAPTPWHQDLSFWPIRGEQICSFWVPLDPVNRESSGLMYVRGSHKWSNRFKAISPDYAATLIDEQMEDVPDINAHPENYDLLDWEMEPGDILMFHPLTLHGSLGNQHRSRARRALALRWTGDDVVYSPSKRRMPIHYRHHSIVGGPLRGAALPRILPSMLADERQARLGREHPSVLGLLGSGWDNFAAALALKLRGVEVRASQGGRP